MTEFQAHELVATVLCKVVGCPEQAVSARGRYAKLCEEHRDGQMREQERARREHLAARAARAPAEARRSLKEAAQAVVPAAAELDRALARRHVARDDARQAFALFKQTLEELQQAAREAIA